MRNKRLKIQLIQILKKRIAGHDVYYALINDSPTYNGNSIKSIVFDEWHQRNNNYIRTNTPLCVLSIDDRYKVKVLSPVNGFLSMKSVQDEKLDGKAILCSIHTSRASVELDDFTVIGQDNLITKLEVNFIINKKEVVSPKPIFEEENAISEEEYSKEALAKHFKSGLGSDLRDKIPLLPEQVAWLNQMKYPASTFLGTIQLISQAAKLYVAYFERLNEHYNANNSDIYETIRNQLIEIKENREYRFRSSYYYDSSYKKFDAKKEHFDLMTELFSLAEQSLKIHYKYGNKTEIIHKSDRILDFFPTVANKIIPEVNHFFLAELEKPNRSTLQFLNETNKTRWKDDFRKIQKNFNSNPEKYFKELKELINLNNGNKSQRLIYFESSKLLVDYRPEISLLHYAIYQIDTEKEEGKVKELPKQTAKKLFRSEEMSTSFFQLISTVSTRFDLLKLKDEIAELLVVKRKKIVLNEKDIKSIHHQQTDVVNKLNEILEEKTPVISEPNPAKQTASSLDDLFENEDNELSEIEFSADHLSMLQLFVRQNFKLSTEKMNTFAANINRFASGIINEINELAYDALEEELILEEENEYSIENTYHQVVSQIAKNEIK